MNAGKGRPVCAGFTDATDGAAPGAEGASISASVAQICEVLDRVARPPGARARYVRVSRRSLLIRHEPSDDLLLKAYEWAKLWSESCARGKPNGTFVGRAVVSLAESARAWNNATPTKGPRREWIVLARYLKLQIARLARGSLDAASPYLAFDQPTPGAKKAARMLASDRFKDIQLGWVLAYAAQKRLSQDETEQLLLTQIGPRFRSRLTRAGLRLRPGKRGRPRVRDQETGADGKESSGLDLQALWSRPSE